MDEIGFCGNWGGEVGLLKERECTFLFGFPRVVPQRHRRGTTLGAWYAQTPLGFGDFRILIFDFGFHK